MKRKLIIGLVVIIVLFTVVLLISLNKKLYSKYYFGETGVTITVFNRFQPFEDNRAKTDVSLYDPEIKTYITGRDLPESFWSSGDIKANCDEYMRMISAMYYDRDIKDVSIDTIKINGVKVGKVSMTAAQMNSSLKATALIFPEKYKHLVIEIYGDEKILTERSNEIDKIIRGVSVN